MVYSLSKLWDLSYNNKMMLSAKNLIFKKRLAKKLIDQYVSLYIINKVVFTNTAKLRLPTSIRIHLVCQNWRW